MLAIVYTNKMKHDVKRIIKRGKEISKLASVLDLLAKREQLPQKHRDRQLKGEMLAFRECHIEPDWLLIYQIHEDELILLAAGTGTHSDLFEE